MAFLCAVKRVVYTSPAMHKLVRQDCSIFLDWIYYHEVLAEFTIRHWYVPYQGCGFYPIPWSLQAREEADIQVGKRSLLDVRYELKSAVG